MKNTLGRFPFILSIAIAIVFVLVPTASAMHIMEGFLPPKWAISWGGIAIPFVILGMISINKRVRENPKVKILLAMAAAFAFVLSALKLPSIAGSSAHPTGVGLGAILFGPAAMAVIGLIVLLFQALLLAHGGITTLGANTFSMAVVGPMVAYLIFKTVDKVKGPKWLGVFLGASIGNLATYAVTSLQLALAFPSETSGILGSLMKFLTIFMVTQIPIAVIEGILTVIIFNAIAKYSRRELEYLNVFQKGDPK